jgi:SAM-dependent methyltransferase
LELGAGWCSFINNVEAPKRIAVDIWSGFVDHGNKGVECHVGSVLDLSFVEPGSVDVVFASNLVEHLTRDEFAVMLNECQRILTPEGRLILLQPNFRLCSNRYFDDFTHVSIWSDISLCDYLESLGWLIQVSHAGFLPLTIKSRLPVSPLLIRAYLSSPFKPFAGQMLVVAQKPGLAGGA